MTAKILRAKTFDLVALVKPSIMVMALLTAAGAMSLAPGGRSASEMLVLLAGVALIVGSANTLNMWLERDVDCLMVRTKDRPLPQGRLEASTALAFGSRAPRLARYWPSNWMTSRPSARIPCIRAPVASRATRSST